MSTQQASYANNQQRMDNQAAGVESRELQSLRKEIPNMAPTEVVSPNVTGATTAATSLGVGFDGGVNPNTGAPMPARYAPGQEFPPEPPSKHKGWVS